MSCSHAVPGIWLAPFPSDVSTTHQATLKSLWVLPDLQLPENFPLTVPYSTVPVSEVFDWQNRIKTIHFKAPWHDFVFKKISQLLPHVNNIAIVISTQNMLKSHNYQQKSPQQHNIKANVDLYFRNQLFKGNKVKKTRWPELASATSCH